MDCQNIGDKKAEQMFMNVAKAYEALTDEEAKANYEQVSNRARGRGSGGDRASNRGGDIAWKEEGRMPIVNPFKMKSHS